MGGAGDDAEVVHVHRIAHLTAQHGQQLFLEFDDDRIVLFHRIHVNHGGAVELFVQAALGQVDGVVQLHHIAVGGHLRVQGDHLAAGAVIVNDQIVNADDVGVGHDLALDGVDEFLLRRAAQKRRDGVLRGAVSGQQNEYGDDGTAPAVHHPAGQLADDHAQQHGAGGNGVAQAVGGRGAHGGGIQLFGKAAVVEPHVNLRQNAGHEDAHGNPGEIHRLRREDLLHRGFHQLQAHQDDDDGDDQAGDVLGATVAERVIRVGLFAGQLEADQRDDRGTGIGQVVQGVRRDGEGAADHAGKQLAEKQQDVQADADRARQHAVGLPDDGGVNVLPVGNEYAGQKSNHFAFLFSKIRACGRFPKFPSIIFFRGR